MRQRGVLLDVPARAQQLQPAQGAPTRRRLRNRAERRDLRRVHGQMLAARLWQHQADLRPRSEPAHRLRVHDRRAVLELGQPTAGIVRDRRFVPLWRPHLQARRGVQSARGRRHRGHLRVLLQRWRGVFEPQCHLLPGGRLQAPESATRITAALAAGTVRRASTAPRASASVRATPLATWAAPTSRATVAVGDASCGAVACAEGKRCYPGNVCR